MNTDKVQLYDTNMFILLMTHEKGSQLRILTIKFGLQVGFG